MKDDDMKIYYTKETMNNKSAELKNVFETMNFHRANGNLAKAKQFGSDMAQNIINSCDAKSQENMKEYFIKKYQTQAVMRQLQVLQVFIVEAVLHYEISSTEIATTALNAMYEEIKLCSPNFYKNISDGAAFTFYYIALGKKGDVGENIGEAFSMLCGIKNAENLIPSLQKVWRNQSAIVHEKIKSCEFELN